MRNCIIVILAFIFLISCKNQNQNQNQNETLLLKIENKRDTKTIVEIYGYPAENYPRNLAGAFDGIMFKDSAFILKMDEDGIYSFEDLSPVYDKSEFNGFVVFVYEPIGDKLVLFGDTPKDTLYYKDFDLETLLNKPVEIIIN